MEDNRKVSFLDETENIYKKETANAIKVPGGMAASVMKQAEIAKRKNKAVFWGTTAVLAVIIVVLTAVICIGAANKNKADPGDTANNSPVYDGTGGENDMLNVDLRPVESGSSGLGENSTQSNNTDKSPGSNAVDSDSQAETNDKSQGNTPDQESQSGGMPQIVGGGNQIDLSNEGKTDEEIDPGSVLEKVGIKAIRILRSCTYDNNGTKLNWYEFYNACIDGTIDPHGDAPRKYAHSMLEIFNENGMTDEAAQAENILNAK